MIRGNQFIRWMIAVLTVALCFGCESDSATAPPGAGLPGGGDPGGDDTGGGGGDTGGGGGGGGGIVDGDSPMHPDDICPAGQCSYIWIANSAESTISKVNTYNAREVARYRTCSGDGPFDCDPSRTSVNLYGDAVATNRHPRGDGTVPVNPDTLERSSVTKFAANRRDCVDRNGDGFITTSTGPDDVLPFGEDECMLWHQELGLVDGLSPRARATGWDGTEDPETGAGGNVIVGTCIAGSNGEWDEVQNNQLYILSGDTGAIVDTIRIPSTECFYGGAMDPSGNFWIMDGFGFPKGLLRVNLNTKSVSRFDARCGYGISVDAQGNVWTGGKHYWAEMPPGFDSCVQKLDVSGPSPEYQLTDQYMTEYLRGIAVGQGKSAGYVWAAERRGSLYRINQNNLTDVTVIHTPVHNPAAACPSYADCPNVLVGVAIDFEGYVWSVSTTTNTALKYDPDTGSFESVPIGEGPYTYSDMTGMQLQGVVGID